MSDTESFEQVMAEMIGKVASPYWTGMADRLKAAHDREIRDVSQREFARGMDAGRHSMDAEHRAVAMRLRHLSLDGGSHENLSQIARAIYHSDWGWTQGACASLRDELVRLMGGVSDDTCGAGCCCTAADCDGDCGLQREEVTDERLADDCGGDTGCGGCGGDLHMAGVTYDVLGNERRKAIANLRKCGGGYTLEWDNVYEIFDALGVDYVGMAMADVYENFRDRLIHLLGGDKPSGIDVLRAMDGESDADGTCPNDVPTSSITDELREWMDIVLTADDQAWSIADRIDAQFGRICQQQEAVLQKTVDEMVKEYEHDRESDQLRVEKLERQRDHWRQQATDMMNHADAMEHERDAAYARTDELSDELLRVRRERDELRAKLAIIRETIDG